VGAGRTDRDEAGQIFVFRTQSVSDPGADGRTDQVRSAGMQAQDGFAVGLSLGVQAPNHAEIIRAFGRFGQQLGYPMPGLAVLTECPRRTQQGRNFLVLVFFVVTERVREFQGAGLAALAVQARLVVECIDLARAAVHEQENDALRPRRMVRRFGRKRSGLGRWRSGRGAEAGEGEIAEPTGRLFQQRAAIQPNRVGYPNMSFQFMVSCQAQSTYRNGELHINAWQSVARAAVLDSGSEFPSPLSAR